jgi:hypothetical protein
MYCYCFYYVLPSYHIFGLGVEDGRMEGGQQVKEVPAGGDTINGYFIPGGISIAINFSAILGSKALFGANADVFRLERFLSLSSSELAEMRRNVEMNLATVAGYALGNHWLLWRYAITCLGVKCILTYSCSCCEPSISSLQNL